MSKAEGNQHQNLILTKEESYNIKRHLFQWVLSLSLGSIILGFNLNLVDSVKVVYCDGFYLRQTFDRVVIGMLPIGAGIGTICLKVFNNKYTRRQWMFIGDLIGAVSITAIMIELLIISPKNNQDYEFFCQGKDYFLLFSQIFLGISVGILTTNSMVMIAQLSTVVLRGPLGFIPFLFTCFGAFILHCIQLLSSMIDSSYFYQSIILTLSLLILSTHAYLIRFKFPQQPLGYLITVGKFDQAKQVLNIIYQQQNIEITEETIQVVADIQSEQVTRTNLIPNCDADFLYPVGTNFKKLSKTIALRLSIYLVIILQGSGIHFYNQGLIDNYVDYDLIFYQYVLRSACMLGGCFFTFVIFNFSKGKRSTGMTFGFALMFFFNALVLSVIFIYFQYEFLYVIALFLTFSFGATIGPIINLYLIQILNVSNYLSVIATNWFLYFCFGPLLSIFSNINTQLDFDHIFELIIGMIISTIITKLAFIFKVQNMFKIRQTALLTPLQIRKKLIE